MAKDERENQAIEAGCHASVKSEMRAPRGTYYQREVRVGLVMCVYQTPRGPKATVRWDGESGAKSSDVLVSALARRDDWQEARAAALAAVLDRSARLAGAA